MLSSIPGRSCGCLISFIVLAVVLAVGIPALTGKPLMGEGGVSMSVLNRPEPTPTPEVVPGYVSEEFASFALEQQRLASRDGFEAGAKIALAFGLSDAASDFAFGAVVCLCILGMAFALVKMR